MSARETLGRWLFERRPVSWYLANAEDAPWEVWTERHHEDWQQEADLVLEQVARLIEQHVDPVEVALSGVSAVTDFLRDGTRPTEDPNALALMRLRARLADADDNQVHLMTHDEIQAILDGEVDVGD